MFSIEIETDNAAFEGTNGVAEIQRIIKRLVDKLDYAENGGNGILYDVNGNECGTWKYEPQREQDGD